MSELWTEAEFGKLQSLTGHDWARWFEDGLILWYEQQDISHAFDPVSDRFSPSRRIEEQVIEMYDKLPDPVGRRFLEGLLILLSEETDEVETEAWEETIDEIAGAIVYRLKHSHDPSLCCRLKI